MRTIDIQDAKSNLARLIEEAAQGGPFVIAREGKPVAKVTAIDLAEKPVQRRTGFLAGEISVPEDFDRMFSREIEQMFGEVR